HTMCTPRHSRPFIILSRPATILGPSAITTDKYGLGWAMQDARHGELGRSRLPGRVTNQMDLCSSVLREARQLVVTRRFGPALGQLVSRATDLLDEIDETLVGVHPSGCPEAFASVAALHRELESIRTQVPAGRPSSRPDVRET